MKKVLLSASSLLLLLSSCTEKGFDVTPRVEGGDTTYTAAVEGAQARTVVLEEFTGVKCPNCPSGHAIVAAMQSQYPGRLLAISYYANGIPQANSIKDLTKEDFRTADATNVNSAIFNVAGLPSAGIDRTSIDNQMFAFWTAWSGIVATRMNVPSPANVRVTSEWTEGDRTAVIRVRVAYTSAVSKKQALTLVLTENDLVDAQEYSDSIVNNYKFKHVLRDIITPVTGEAMLDEFPTKEPGRVYERTFVYNVSDKWKADKCSLIAFVHNAESGDLEVVQAGEAELAK